MADLGDTAPVPRPPASWATYVYYYLAALIGLGVLVGGLIAFVDGFMTILFPSDPGEFGPVEGLQGFEPFGPEDRVDGLREALRGILVALIGGAVFAWHLNEVRRREGDPAIRLPWRRR